MLKRILQYSNYIYIAMAVAAASSGVYFAPQIKHAVFKKPNIAINKVVAEARPSALSRAKDMARNAYANTKNFGKKFRNKFHKKGQQISQQVQSRGEIQSIATGGRAVKIVWKPIKKNIAQKVAIVSADGVEKCESQILDPNITTVVLENCQTVAAGDAANIIAMVPPGVFKKIQSSSSTTDTTTTATTTTAATTGTTTTGTTTTTTTTTTTPTIVNASISSVTIPANGTYSNGQNLSFSVTFTNAVTVTGTPRIALTIGASTVYATYASGSGTTTLVFSYAVQTSDYDADGITVTSPIDTNGGSIVTSSSTAATLTFITASTAGILVDTPVSIASVAAPANGTYTTNDHLDFTVTTTKAVTVTGVPRITLTIGSSTVYANYTSGTGTTSLVFRYTVAAGDNDGNGIAMTSPVGLNGGTIQDANSDNLALAYTLPDTTGVLVDTPPTISSVTAPANGTYVATNHLDFTVATSENVTVTGTPRIALTIGASTVYANYLSGSGTSSLVFRYTVVSTDLDTDGIAMTTPIDANGGTLKDSTGNDLALAYVAPNTTGILVDTPPTITSVTAPGNATYTTGNHLDFTVATSQNITVTGAPRIALTIGSSTVYATYLSGSGSQSLVFRYTVASGDYDSDGIAMTSPIDLNAGTMKGADTSNLTLTYTAPNTTGVLVDTPTIITSVTAPANATYTTGNNLDFTVATSQTVTVTGVPRIALTVGSSTVYATYLSGSGTASLVFRYTVASGDYDSDGIAMTSPIDLNGGTMTGADTNNVILTYTAPNTTGVKIDTPAIITSVTAPANATYNVGNNLDFTVATSQNITVTGAPRIALTLASGTVYAAYLSGSGTASLVFRYTVISGDEAPNGIAMTSPIGLNGGTMKGADTNNMTLTYTAPTTTSVLVYTPPIILSVTAPANGTYTNGQNLDFTVATSENITVTGTPRIQLTIGASTVYANYLSGSGTSSLVFRYAVQAADNDSDGITMISPIGLNGGTLKDASNSNLTLTYTLPDTSAVLVANLGAFDVSGITGASDATADAYLNGGLNPIINWSASTSAASYDVTIYQSDGTTVQCATQNTAATSYDFTACGALTASATYKVKVVAKNAGATLTKNATTFPYSFVVNSAPTIHAGGNGAWYVLSGGSIDINAQWAAAPAVGVATDAESDTLTFSAVGAAGFGTVTNNSTSVHYAPGANVGVDTFTFTISDGHGGTVSGTMTINVVSPYTWSGGGADANWNTPGNWCKSVNANKNGCTNGSAGGDVPTSSVTASNVAIFNGTCSSNCSATINTNASVYQLALGTGYSGTITQSGANTLTVGAGGISVVAGTYTGAGGSGSISDSGAYAQTGGSFTTGTGAITISGTYSQTGGTFALGNTANTATFTGAATQAGGTFTGSSGPITYSTSLSVTAGTYTATSGTTTVSKNFAISAGVTFSHSNGIVQQNRSDCDGSGYYITTGTPASQNFYDLKFVGGCGIGGAAGGTIHVAHTLTGSGTQYVYSGTIEVEGNVVDSAAAISSTVKLVGGNAQTITGNTTYPGSLGHVIVAKNVGTTATFSGSMNMVDFTYTSGTVDASASTITTIPCVYNVETPVITPGSVAFNNFTISECYSQTTTISGTLTVTGNFALTGNNGDAPVVNGGTVAVAGNLSASYWGGGTTAITINGGGAQSITTTSSTWPTGNVTINKAGGTVTLASDTSFNGGAQTCTLTAGAIDMNGKAFTVHSLSLNGTTVTKNAGTLTVGGVVQGTGALFGGTVNP